VADHLTEEEQVEALKRWWKENGSSILVTVLLVVAGYWGWQFWQSKQKTESIEASVIYEELLQAVGNSPGRDADKTSTAKHLAKQLSQDYSGFYAQSGHLFLAKLAVEENDLGAAETELKAALAAGPSPAMVPLVALRLAEVLQAGEQLDAALQVLAEHKTDGFKAAFAETRGDIYLQQAELNKARAAYQLALDSEPEFSQRQQLEQKLDDLAVSGSDAKPNADAATENKK